ncbi:DUF3841 domain-containing protein [Clostridium sp. MT-14]|uniref:DUF3841 domain-containing protein n=1 Tax=Clostridium aromativorans TaxID=2836848 RepID=A0ABS8NAQ8_9CLOT|nr:MULTISPECIES: DUF3841 domain-containing protein [Clostridium]KAA8677529.1 DUF3841 domain-containing protein [Clostridium sp. HV4-5-A1G]MCC9295773.1 DUF3841 domain-containing protein [Clostridium aromativorans]CAB1246465.1 conserved hypothetical protein [Clostridiaceae bacterium BL-3]
MGAKNNKVILYTSQSSVVVKSLMEQKICHVKREYIVKKYQEVSQIFLEAYDWYISKARNIVEKPEHAEYPFWTFTEIDYAGWYPGNYLLCLNVPIEKIIFFKIEDWNKILNLKYLSVSKEDGKEYECMLAKQNISIESDIFTKPFYPNLKLKVKKSWDNLFKYDKLVKSGIMHVGTMQAALWELKKEWISYIKEEK